MRAIAVVLLALLVAACAEFPTRNGGGGGFAAPPGGVYTVHRGDTLYSIAWRHNLDFRTVARWNDISAPYTIYPGQRIRLSPPPASSTASVRKPTSSADGSRGAEPTPPADPESADSALSWQWPTRGRVVRDFTNNHAGKRGIEIGGEAGQAIRAAASGRVVYSGNGLRGYGNLIIIKHNSRYLTAYGYNRDLLVEEGARVDAGQRIARMGPGPESRPALHFELRRDGKPIDPVAVLPPR